MLGQCCTVNEIPIMFVAVAAVRVLLISLLIKMIFPGTVELVALRANRRHGQTPGAALATAPRTRSLKLAETGAHHKPT
jgi:hypothetical protein